MPAKTKTRKKKKLPIQVTRRDFNRYILPNLYKPKKGPKPKVSLFKIFNYMLYVLHTGIQWKQLKTYKNEIHWSNVYKWHSRWSKKGSYRKLFESSVSLLACQGLLDISVLHGDGSNTVAKKGALASVIPGTSTRKARKSSA